MLTVDDARSLAAAWREQFVDVDAFEESWSRYFETATVPDVSRLEAWLAKDLAKDQVKHAGIVREPLLPVHQRFTIGDEDECDTCKGKRYVRRELDKYDPEFGKAIPCPRCNR